MPTMEPVADKIVPPDPGRAINTFSGILGLQKQRQELQTGQYHQQTAQAEAIKSQQSAKEVQAGAQLLADPVGNGLVDEEGNPTKGAYSIIKSVMPTSGDERYQSLLKTAQGHVEFRSAVQNLSQNEQGYVSSRLAGIAADPDAHISDVVNGINDLQAQFKGTAEEASVKRLVGVMKSAIDDSGDKHGMDGVRKVITGFSRGALGNAGISGSGGVAAPSMSTMQGPGGLQAVNTNPNAPGGIGPRGAPMQQGVAPSVVQSPAGPLARVGNNGSTMTPLTSAGPDLNPTHAQVNTQTGLAAGVTNRVSQTLATANNTVQAQDALTRAKAMLESKDAPTTGAAFERKKQLKNLMASLGVDVGGATDDNTLVKNLARYEAARATAAGLGGTDAARELAHSGSPNTQIDREALKGIVNQSLATEKALAAYASKQSKTKDPDQLTKNENAFRNIPNLIEGYEYGMARDAKEADAFLTRHGLSKADMKKTRAAIKAFEGE